jgi:uncharacterized protein YkwD
MGVETKCFSCGRDLVALPFVCKFCGHSFCVKHHLPENHNCEGLKKWKRSKLEKAKKSIGFEGFEKQKPLELSEPFVESPVHRTSKYSKFSIKSYITQTNILKRIKFWFNNKNHPYSKLRFTNFIKNLIFLIILTIVSVIIYKNVQTLNNFEIIFIRIGSLLLIVTSLFILKFSYKLFINIKYGIRGLKNGYKLILLILLLFFVFHVYQNQEIYIPKLIGKIKSINYSYFNPLFIDLNQVSEVVDESNYGTNLGCSVIQIQYNYESSEEDSKAAIDYLNKIRKQYGKNEISFDKRVFELAVARAKDMRDYNYLDHTNPITGTCPDNMKSNYGLKLNEYVAENAFGNPQYSEGICTKIEIKPMTDAIDDWMTSRGHRYNLLYDNHIAGAVGCYKNMCSFLGLNYDRFGEGCHTAAEGQEFWKTVNEQPGEVG